MKKISMSHLGLMTCAAVFTAAGRNDTRRPHTGINGAAIIDDTTGAGIRQRK